MTAPIPYPSPIADPPPPGAAPRPGAGGGRLPVALAACALVAWLASWALPASESRGPDIRLDSWAEVEARLRAAVASPRRRPFVVIGDSVVAGNMLRSATPETWAEWRLVPQLASLAAPGASASFHDLSSPGLLPADARSLVARLDELDPDRRVGVVLEVDLRYFSRAYAPAGASHSQPFLARPPGPFDTARWPLLGPLLGRLRESRGGLGGARERVAAWLSGAAPDLVGAATGEDATATDLRSALYRLRARPHFLDLDLSPGSAQVRAFDDLVGLLRSSSRPALLFLTPVNESWLAEPGEEGTIDAATARIASRVEDGPTLRLVDFDDEAFVPERFLDHVHLTPEGNSVLAARLLAELGVPGRLPLAPGEAPPPPADLSLVVGGIAQGNRDGAGTKALFRDVEDLALLSPGQLVVADTGNHALRRVRVGRRTSEPWVGRAGEAGHRDGAGEGALFSSPARLAADGAAGVFVLDRGTDTVRHVSRGGEVSSVAPYDRPREGPPRLLDLAALDGRAWVLDAERRAVVVLPSGPGGDARIAATFRGTDPVSFDLDEAGDLWLLTAAGTLHRLDAGRLAEGTPPDVSEIPPVAAASPDGAGAYFRGIWGSRHFDKELPLVPLADLPLQDPARVVATRRGRRVLVLDRVGDRSVPWLLSPAEGEAVPWLPSDVRGSRYHPQWPHPFPVHPPLTFDPDSGDLYGALTGRSLVYRWRAATAIRDWRWEEGGPRVADRDPEALSVAVLGSSILGRAGDSALDERGSFAAALEPRLRAHPRIAGRRIEVRNRTAGRQSLAFALTTLMAEPPGSVRVAVFSLEPGSMKDLVGQGRSARFGPDGLPLYQRGPGQPPFPITADDAPPLVPGDESGVPELRRLLSTIRLWCDREGIVPLFLDLLPLGSDLGFDTALPQGCPIPPETVRREVRDAGMPVLEAWRILALDLPSGYPQTYDPEGHLTLRAYGVLAEAVAAWMAPRLDAAFEAAAAPPRQGGPPPTPAPLLDLADDLDRSLGLPDGRLSTYPEGDDLGVIADLTDEALPADPGSLWRRALWVAARHSPRAGEGRGVVVSFIVFQNINEYGQFAWDSTRVLARFRVGPGDLPGTVEGAEALLRAEAEVPPPWLVRR